MLNISNYQTAKNVDKPQFMQLKSVLTGELETTEEGKPVGIELHSMHSRAFTNALRDTVDLDLDQEEKQKQKDILKWIAEGVKPSQESKEFLEYCEKKTTDRFTRVYALITTKLVNLQLTDDDAKTLGVKIGKNGDVSCTTDNLVKFYSQLPDVTKQMGDFMAERKNFMVSSSKS
jgi:hypothetical protein